MGPTERELSDASSFVHWGYGEKNDDKHLRCDARRDGGRQSARTGGSKKRKFSDAGDDDRNNEQPADGTETAQSVIRENGNSFRKAIGIFLSSGCCVLEKPVLPRKFVQTCLDRAKSDYRYLEGLMTRERDKLLRNHGTTNHRKDGSNNNKDDDDNGNDTNNLDHHRMVALTRQDYAEWVARDGGRVDIRYGLNRYPYNSGGLIYNSVVFPLVRALLNGNSEDENHREPVQLLYVGIMWGMPMGGHNDKGEDDVTTTTRGNGPHQKWHADGGHLFAPHQLPRGLTLPPHCINVFYPLVDLTEDNGPTEFRIASHRFDDTSNNGDVEFSLTCPAGGAVLFDYRIQHRGRANQRSTGRAPPSSSTGTQNGVGRWDEAELELARPVLYLAYAKPYFRDHGNTRSGRRLVPTGTDLVWSTRTLEGRPLPYGKGFDEYAVGGAGRVGTESPNGEDAAAEPTADTQRGACDDDRGTVVPEAAATAEINDGVGERWILFQMTLELPNGTSETLKVYRGDVAVEVAQQFCFQHELQDDFVSVLAQTIQGQMDQCY